MGVEERGDRYQQLEESYKDYTVYDQHYERIGKVDDLFVDEHDQPEYIGVKTGFLGMKSTLIPMEIARVNDLRKLVEVSADKNTITEGPAFDDDDEITRDHEARIYGYYGLTHPGSQEGRGGYGDYYDSEERPDEDLAGSVDTQYGERKEEPPEQPARESPVGGPPTDRPEGATGDTRSREPEPADPTASREPQHPGDTGEAGTGSSLRVRKRVSTDNR